MTLNQLQGILDSTGTSIVHMGWASRSSQRGETTRWSVTIMPERYATSRWDRELRWRGTGPSLEAALASALDKLAASALLRE